MNFEQEFRSTSGQPFTSEGIEFMLSYCITVPLSGVLLIRYKHCILTPKQGIRLDCAVEMSLDKDKSNAFNIWCDSKMRTVSVSCKPASKVMIRNLWDHGDGVVQSWHAGAAMHAETSLDGAVILYCNSTLKNTRCRDLIVEIASG